MEIPSKLYEKQLFKASRQESILQWCGNYNANPPTEPEILTPVYSQINVSSGILKKRNPIKWFKNPNVVPIYFILPKEELKTQMDTWP